MICLKLFFVLMGLMTVNQIMGTTYGTWKEGFQKEKFEIGLYKMAILCIGYGAVALTALLAGEYIPGAEYVSGLLLDPIARYFTKLVTDLRCMVNEKTG